ncbi:hypothetical protein, partial [Phenylobacterium sp.]|uniref:hypothetical protein n=1 Tax=Phenylobacterium sp. TaxID=1871053 RepID=UPI0025E436CB
TNTAWQPNAVLVSGTIGSATYSNGAYSNIDALNHVKLFATQDIIIGSQRFIGLVQPTSDAGIEIGKNTPTGVAATPAEQNRVLVTAGDLELSAANRVVSQNTAPTTDQSVGLFITGKTSPNLTLDPPQLVDLYGSFLDGSGAVVSSFSAGGGVKVAIVDAAGNPASPPPGAVYRFNSCAVDTNQCSAAAAVTSNLQQNTPTLTVSLNPGSGAPGGDDAQAGARAANDRNAGTTLLPIAPVEADELLFEPVVTGSGSEEIWRKRLPEPDKKPEAKP